jgi:hypothetical protein
MKASSALVERTIPSTTLAASCFGSSTAGPIYTHPRSRGYNALRRWWAKPFDNGALYAFLRDRAGLPKLGRPWRDPDKWFCSEYVIRALEVGGLFPYLLITPKDTVSPNTLLVHINPFMSNDNIMEFL